MRAKHISNIFLAAVLCVSCTELQTSAPNESGEQGTLTLTTRTTDEKVDNFANGATLRLAIYESDATELTPYLEEDYGTTYEYIYMIKASDIWSYSFDKGVNKSSNIGFIKDEQKEIDIVAAYPYITSADMSSVAFSLASNNLSYMWATSKNTSLATSDITADLHFQYFASAINLAISTANYTTGTTLQYITLTLTDAAGNPKEDIISTGTINFFDSTITPTLNKDTQEIYVNYNIYPSTYTSYSNKIVYIPPFEMAADDKLNIAFKIDGVYINDTIDLTGADFKYDNEEKYGFERGYQYTITAVLDNYLKFSGTITKDDTWSDGGTISPEV